MADFVLTQTDAQVQSVLNDAQDAQGAGAQTTLTTEYVMLKDTNGRYHKILKSSLTEACRNVLASLLVNNDKGTTINQIAAIASGDFGSITPANLASVLGVIPFNIPTTVTISDDCNNAPLGASWMGASTSIQNKPGDSSSNGWMFTIQRGSDIVQTCITTGMTQFYRVKTSGTWREWNQVYDTSLLTNNTLLNTLASALKPYLDAL